MIKFYLSNIKFLFFANIYFDYDKTLTKCSDVIVVKGSSNNDCKARLYYPYDLSDIHKSILSNSILIEDPDFSKSSNLEIYGLHIFINEEELFYLTLKYGDIFY